MSGLRDYQREALAELHAAWAGGERRVGVALPTGVGKTHIMAHLAKDAAARPGHERVLMLVHRDVLVEQTLAKVRATVPSTTSVGVLKGPRNELGARVIVASVHSLQRPERRAQLPPVSTCVVDEAHVSVTPTYRAVFDQIGAFRDGGANLAGFTATWSRGDSLGLGDVWQRVVFRRSIGWAIRHGHLCRPRALRVGDGVQLGDVRTSRATGDYREDDLERAVMLEEIRDVVVRGAQEHEPGRPTVLFAPTVASAEYLADGLRAAGIATAGIYHSTGPAERRRIFGAHQDGDLRVLTTCTALAVGWDAPYVSRGLLCRPTTSEVLFVQSVGRLLRPWPGKPDALLLDFVGVTSDATLAAAVDLSPTRPPREDADDQAGGQDEDELPADGGRTPGRAVRLARVTREVDLLAGTNVHWLTGPAGVPFVPCGESVVFVVEGRDGDWCVGQAPSDGRGAGRFLAQGLAQEDALTVAGDYAEDLGAHISRRSAAWRSRRPSDAQLAFAGQLGYVPAPGEQLTQGEVSDEISVRLAERALRPLADWSRQWREWRRNNR